MRINSNIYGLIEGSGNAFDFELLGVGAVLEAVATAGLFTAGEERSGESIEGMGTSCW
jgi:hypothetical protein